MGFTVRRLTGVALLVGACRTSAVPQDAAVPLDIPSTDVPPTDVPVPDVPVPDVPPPPADADTPFIPIGLDAYRAWDRLPYVRMGARTYLRSTYDRAGGNEAADASHFIRQTREDFNVALDVQGPGELYFVRTNHWHGSPWHYVLDGTDHGVSESSTATPDHPVMDSVFLPPGLFPPPLAETWSLTQGADLNWVPLGFTQSLTLAWGRTHYGTGYFILQRFPPGAGNLSRPLTPWDGTSPPDPDVVALVNRAGEDIAPVGPTVQTVTGTVDLPAGATVPLGTLPAGPAMVRAFTLTAPRGSAVALGNAHLRITWDNRDVPSVDVPVSLFFGAGTLANRDGRTWLVRGLLASVQYTPQDVHLSFYYPMPYQSAARVELVGADTAVPNLRWQVRTVPYTDPPSWVGYFHATYRDHGTPVPGHDLVLLDTTATEGGGDWCGSFVGTSFIFSDRAVLGTLEGDPRFFFDDAQSPQGQGTGTEEWGGGGDYWGGQYVTLPFAGHPTGVPSPGAIQTPEDGIESAYRFLLADAFPFGRNARIQLEHGPVDDSTEHYRTVTYWYGRPGACLVPTDRLHVGDPADEAAHAYVSPTASAPETLTTRYELGVDTLPDGTTVYPPVTDTGRHMTDVSTFTVRIDPAGKGVMLRRTFDQTYADQRAEVSVADDRDGAPFVPAGVWYTAGSNRCVFADSDAEVGPSNPMVRTSNRRWREDELLLPRALTDGRSSIRVRVHFTPVAQPLTPGGDPGTQAWSEFRYAVYTYVLPGR